MTEAILETKTPRSFAVTVHGPDDTNIRFFAIRKKDGSATSHAVHSLRKGKKRENTRGASSQHSDMDTAKTQVEKLVAKAVKAGWVRREARGGFRAKPDAFSEASLPKPPAARKR